MPSQPLPTSAKVESLPEDLRSIAEKLLRKRYHMDGPEIMHRSQWNSSAYGVNPYDPASINIRRYRFELRVIGAKDQYRAQQLQMAAYGKYYTAGHTFNDPIGSYGPPKFIEFMVMEGDHEASLIEKVRRQVARIEDEHNVIIEVREA